jgi:hypothetical protein
MDRIEWQGYGYSPTVTIRCMEYRTQHGTVWVTKLKQWQLGHIWVVQIL